MKIFMLTLCSFILMGCDTPPRANETADCRQAKSEHAFCTSDCLGSARGTFMQALGRCGNVCRPTAINVSNICR